jgi:HK97 family phage major capsid protein
MLFKRRGPEKPPVVPEPARREDSLGGDLRRHLAFMLRSVPLPERRTAHWVMSLEWLNEVRKLDCDDRSFTLLPPPPVGDGPETVMGLPVEVREDAGAPELVTARA